MKSHVIAVLAMMLSLQSVNGAKTYTNPIIDVNLPDPTVLRDDDGTYYMTGTENIRNLGLFSSPDLVDWTLTGTIFKDGDKRPDTLIWAPELCRINGKYVLFYCSRVPRHHRPVLFPRQRETLSFLGKHKQYVGDGDRG